MDVHFPPGVQCKTDSREILALPVMERAEDSSSSGLPSTLRLSHTMDFL